MLTGIVSGKTRRPRRVLLYGTHGIGKSTWAAAAPNPIFLTIEDGLNDIGCDRTPLLNELGQVNNWVSNLIQQDHEYRTLVIDTVDWLEKLIHDNVALESGKRSIEEIGYGKGYLLAIKHWDFILRSLDALREKRNMAVILLAHARSTKYDPPDGDGYFRYEPDLHKTVSPTLQEWADEVFFANYRVDVIQKEEKFNQTRTRAVGCGERVIFTTEMPTHLAKRRVVMPNVIPMSFAAYSQYLKPQEQPNIAGVVTDGSSKPKEE
jgi:hypothetical protein